MNKPIITLTAFLKNGKIHKFFQLGVRFGIKTTGIHIIRKVIESVQVNQSTKPEPIRKRFILQPTFLEKVLKFSPTLLYCNRTPMVHINTCRGIRGKGIASKMYLIGIRNYK